MKQQQIKKQNGTVKAKFVKEITVVDPDSNLEVKLVVYKEKSGGMFAIDTSFEEDIFSPFGHGLLATNDAHKDESEEDTFEVSHGGADTIIAKVTPNPEMPYVYVRVKGKVDVRIKADEEGVVVDLYDVKGGGLESEGTCAIAYSDLEEIDS